VAWRLNQDGIEFHNYYGDIRWSNADLWDTAASWLQANKPGLGVRINKSPARGAVAQWNSMHVAYVSAVHNDGTITIEEYNRNFDGRFGSRRISATAVDNYIHFR
jgi:surface antigen